MKAQTFFLAASAFSGVLAVPLRERAEQVYTVTSDVIDWVSVTSTVWVNPGESTSVAAEAVQTETQTAAAYTPSTTHHRHADFHSKAPSSAASSVAVTPSTTPTVEAAPSTTVVPTTSSTPVFTPPTSTTPTTTYTPPAVTTSSSTEAPSTTEAPPTTQAPSTTQALATSISVDSAPATTTAASSGGSGYGSFTGKATYFIDGLGSCGWTSSATDKIVAISHTLMDAAGGSNGNPLCGKGITITAENGNTVDVKVVDRCVACGQGDLDLSEGAFEALGYELGVGTFSISWSYT